jgi:hypothetical protein
LQSKQNYKTCLTLGSRELAVMVGAAWPQAACFWFPQQLWPHRVWLWKPKDVPKCLVFLVLDSNIVEDSSRPISWSQHWGSPEIFSHYQDPPSSPCVLLSRLLLDKAFDWPMLSDTAQWTLNSIKSKWEWWQIMAIQESSLKKEF